jgi:hypothetical protein
MLINNNTKQIFLNSNEILNEDILKNYKDQKYIICRIYFGNQPTEKVIEKILFDQFTRYCI